VITGVSHPTFGATATFAMVTNTAHADYPVTNLAEAKESATPFRAAASGVTAFSFVLPANQAVEFVGLARHNGTNGATWRIKLYDDAGLTSQVYDSTALTLDIDAASLFSTTTPHRLPSGPITIRGGVITLSDIGVAWQIAALIPAGFWDLTGFSGLTGHDARSLGLKSTDGKMDVGEGVFHGTRQFSPRAFTLGNSLIDWTVDGRTFHDFGRATGLSEAFVWVRDIGDDATWARECALVRNQSLPALTKNAGLAGGLALDMIEHLQ
jgi:hypothetical protein